MLQFADPHDSPLPLSLPTLIPSSTSNSGSKSNCNCSSICKWKMSTKRARIAFPIAIKNIYNANAAHSGTKRQIAKETVRHIDWSSHRLQLPEWESTTHFVASALRTVFACHTKWANSQKKPNSNLTSHKTFSASQNWIYLRLVELLMLSGKRQNDNKILRGKDN